MEYITPFLSITSRLPFTVHNSDEECAPVCVLALFLLSRMLSWCTGPKYIWNFLHSRLRLCYFVSSCSDKLLIKLSVYPLILRILQLCLCVLVRDQCYSDLLRGEIELKLWHFCGVADDSFPNINICLYASVFYTRIKEDVRRFFVLLRGPGRVKFCSLLVRMWTECCDLLNLKVI